MSEEKETAQFTQTDRELQDEIAYIHTIIHYLSLGYSSRESGYLAAGLATEQEIRAFRIRPGVADFWLALAYTAAREMYYL